VTDALQMRFHFGERDRDGDGPLEAAVMDACARRGVRAAALLRAVEGYGAKHRMRTDRLLSLSEDPPLVAVAVGDAGEIEGLADEVREIAAEGLIVFEPVEVLGGGGAETVSEPVSEGEGSEGAAGDEDSDGPPGDVVKVTIWGPRTGPTAPHLGAVAALRRHGAESATVLLGVDGVLEGERRRARFIAGNRGVPAMTVAVGKRAAIDGALAEVDGAAHLVTVEPVESYSPIAGASHHSEGGVERKSVIDRVRRHGDAGASAIRVTLVTSEIASRGGHPAYLEFIHQLRREGAPGTTALRGVWGYRGEGEPHGDRVLALRRDVPMVVETVDSPEGVARWLELARSLACEGDVVHVQSIPTAVALT
jgi:PII-like signaling protein